MADVADHSADTTPTIHGTVDSDAVSVSVVIKDADGKVVETVAATLDGNGAWTVDASALADGDYTAVATATDDAGNTSTATENGFEVDTTAPIAIDDPIQTISGLKGEYWGYDDTKTGQGNLNNYQQIKDYIAANKVEINFISTEVDYHKGYNDLADDINSDGVPSNLISFLNDDASSIEGSSTEAATDGIIKLSGKLNITEGGTFSLSLIHDDGFVVIIDGVEYTFNGNTSSQTTQFNNIQLSAGQHTVEVYYWDQGGAYVFEMALNDSNGDNVWIEDNLSHDSDKGVIEVNEGGDVDINILGNDSEQIDVIITIGLAPQHGVVIINTNGTVTYQANDNYSGSDSFSYTITDAAGNVSNAATVTIGVKPIADAPTLTIEPDDGSTVVNKGIEGTPIALSAISSALNDNDGSESLVLTVSGVPLGSILSDGTNTVTSDGSVIDITDWNLAELTFNSQATGDSTTYTLSFTATSTEDTGVGPNKTASTTVDLDVTVTDTAPVAVDDIDSVGYGGTIYGNVITGVGGQTDGEDQLSVDTVSLTKVNGQDFVNGELTLDTTSGTITFQDDGSYVYTSELSETKVASGNLESASWATAGISIHGLYGGTANSYGVYDGAIHLGLNVNNLAGAPNNAHSNNGANGIGVASGSGAVINGDDSLVLSLGTSTNNISLSFGKLNSVEYARVYGYDEVGNVVGYHDVRGSVSQSVTETLQFSSDVAYISITPTGNSSFVLTGTTLQGDSGNVDDETFDYVITDSDGDTSEATLTVEHTGDSTAFDDGGTVFESGLTGGTSEGSSVTVLTGNLLDNDAGIGASTAITAVDGSTVTGGSSTITVSMDQGTLVVYIADDGSNRAGDYTYTLDNAVNVVGEGTTDSISYQLTDQSSGHQTTAQFNVNIIDDAPVANNVELTLEAASEAYTVNLIIVLDQSGSMGWSAGDDTGRTRMEVAKEAITSMLGEYDKVGNVNIQFVGFSTSATKSQWFEDDLFAAMDYLDNGFVPGGGTYYDIALNSVMTNHQVPSGNAADKSLVYFMSDGAPNSNHGIDLNEQAAWEGFLNSNNIDTSFAIGVGGSTTLSELNPIGYPNTGDNGDLEPNTIKISSAADLSDTLLSTIDKGILSGNVSLLATSGNAGAALGADGGFISEITIDGITYYYQPGDATSEISIDTIKGGTLTLDLSTLEYSYKIELDKSITGEQDIFNMTIVDNDGDSTQLDMIINLEYQANLDANRDLILTNQDGVTTLEIPTLALMHNDTSGISGDISAISNETDATVISNNSQFDIVKVTVTSGNNLNDVSFDYTLNNNNANDQATVSFEEINGLTITGGDRDEILLGSNRADILIGNAGDDALVGGSNGDHLNGGTGDDLLMGQDGEDTLIGGDGDDTLIGGSGNDLLTGGAGIDTAMWFDGDQGTEQAPAIDHIVDFDISEDKLDLSDLLQGVGSDDLSNYLDMSFTDESDGSVTTTINIHTEGNGSGISQVIILDNVDLSTAYSNVDLTSPEGINSILNDLDDPLIF